MASIAELNVRLGLIYKDLDKGLSQVERKLRTSGQRLSQLGSDLTLAISAPLAAFGASAIQAAGDMEALQKALETTMANGGRSIGEARAELEALRKSALAPGLDFEQAVRGSVRLQNVGFSAEEARRILEQLANAVATTGGSAQELDSVTRQFGQMIAKGRIMQEDLSIIQENMPAISAAMEKAFGTKSADRLRAMGVSAEDFIQGVTKQLEGLKRVDGGIKNAITNAGSAIKQFLASVGQEIYRTLDLGRVADDFAKFLQEAAMWFRNLDDSTKKAAIQIALFVVALGPAVKVMSVLQSTGAATINFFRTFAGTLKSITGVAANAVAAFARMNNALKLTVIGAAVAVILALSAAFSDLSDNMSTSAKLAAEVESVNVSANQSILEQKNRVEQLTGILKSHNATQQQRKDALAELNRISPEYFGNLKLEKGLVAGLKQAQDAYIDSLLRAALVKAAEEKIVQLQKERLDIQEQLNKAAATGGQTAANATKELLYRIVDVTGAFSKLAGTNFAANQTRDQIENFGKLTGESIALETRLRGVIEANTDFATILGQTQTSVDNVTASTSAHAQSVKDVEIEYDGAIRRVGLWAQSLLNLQSVQEAARLARPLEQLPQAQTTEGQLNPVESLNAGATSANNIAAAMATAKAAIDATKDSFASLAEVVSLTTGGPLAQMQVMIQGIQQNTGFIGDAMAAAAGAIASAAASGADSFAELGKAALDAALSIARALIIEASLRAATNAIKNGGIFGAIAAVAIGGLVAGGLTALVKSIKIPAFEKGTLNAPGGLSLVGEKGPELVNLPKGAQVFPNNFLGAMGGAETLTTRVRGNDLLFILERAQNRAKRTRGF